MQLLLLLHFVPADSVLSPLKPTLLGTLRLIVLTGFPRSNCMLVRCFRAKSFANMYWANVCLLFSDADLTLRSCSTVDVIVSNPPYLFTQDMETLQPEILRYIHMLISVHLIRDSCAHSCSYPTSQ